MSNLADRLAEERLRLGLTPGRLAAHGGVTQGDQFDYEKGTQLPDADYLSKIAMQGACVQYLLTGRPAAATCEATSDYLIDPVVAARLPAEVIESTIKVFHQKLWDTAEELSNIYGLNDSGSPHTPEFFIANRLAALGMV